MSDEIRRPKMEASMSTKRISSQRVSTVALAAVFLTGMTGCKGNAPTVDDPTLTTQVQQRIASDSALASEPVQVMAQAGVVTLTGAVSNAAARSLAANDAAGITGVQKVVNDITVSAPMGPASSTTTTHLQQPQPEIVPPPRERIRASAAQQPALITRSSAAPPGPQQQQPQSYPVQQAPAPPPPLPQPVARVVTLPAGSTLPVRVTQTLDSATAQVGDTFSGAVATDIVQDGMLLIPRGATVTGRVSEVHEAAHFKGSALLTVELTNVNAKGERISLSTQPYTVEGKGRGKNTAVKTGIGAAAGAVLGGIFGGGKGAAIGAAAGGGTGAAINGVTRGDQVQIPSESVVRFVTTSSLTVRTSPHAGVNNGEPTLRDRQ
jgi:hypothetical protein